MLNHSTKTAKIKKVVGLLPSITSPNVSVTLSNTTFGVTVTEMICVFYQLAIFLEIKITFFDTQYSVNESRATMGLDGSGLECNVNFGSGWVTLVLGRVKKIGPLLPRWSNSGCNNSLLLVLSLALSF